MRTTFGQGRGNARAIAKIVSNASGGTSVVEFEGRPYIRAFKVANKPDLLLGIVTALFPNIEPWEKRCSPDDVSRYRLWGRNPALLGLLYFLTPALRR